MEEFSHRKAKGDQKDKAIISDKDGSLKTVDEYGQISLGQRSYRLGKLPYLF